MDKDRAKNKRDLVKKHEQEKHASKAHAAGSSDSSVSSIVAASRQKQLHRKV
jgi:hypothetical protein